MKKGRTWYRHCISWGRGDPNHIVDIVATLYLPSALFSVLLNQKTWKRHQF